MKLVFPGGEHPQVLLGPGVNRVGSDPAANIVLDSPGVQPSHCELHVTANGVMLQVPPGTSVGVNGHRVDGLISLRPGDSVEFDQVTARLASMDAVAPRPHDAIAARQVPAPANDDPGATAVHPVLPRFVLRGVSDLAFGRSYPLVGPVVVGRAPDCGLSLAAGGLSRQHARLVPSEEGVLVEDLGSTNGSFINGQRVQRAIARPGDEIGFDRMRFRLVAPGQQAAVQVRPAAQEAPAVPSPWWWVAIAAAAISTLWALALLR
ncbi:MAG TPA: FHA domain-containing protein [Xanthomonadaceae bacterium]|nr:FHA domain-containing protein [Xanthomonadaceae bacterium]